MGGLRRLAPRVFIFFAGACASVEGLTGGAPLDGGPDGPSTPDASFADGHVDTSTCAADLQTSPLNCGRCGHSCLGGECAAGRCQPIVLAAAQPGPAELFLSDGHVYWRNASGNGSVLRTSAAGGSVATTMATCANAPGIARDETHVYANCFCNVEATSLDGGSTVASPSGCGRKFIALDQSALYFAGNGTNIYRHAPKGEGLSGASTQTIGDYGAGTLYSLVQHEGLLFHTIVNGPNEGQVAFVSAAGGNITSLAPNEDNPRKLAVDDAGAAWIDLGPFDDGGATDAGLVRTQKLVGEAAKTVARLDVHGGAIAIDATYVYFATRGTAAASFTDGAIHRMRRDGSGSIELVAAGQPSVEDIAVNNEAVFWVTRATYAPDGSAMPASGAVKKVAKP